MNAIGFFVGMKTIVLVGFSGAGKSRMGKRLSARLGCEFYDTDRLFEQKFHLSIPDFFKKYGENAFRICENVVLEEVLKQEGVVIATGGGTPCRAGAMERINQAAFSVYIQLSPVSLCNRLACARQPRPLTDGMTPEQLTDYVFNNLKVREQYYSKAHLTVKGENLTVDTLLDALRECGQLQENEPR